MSVGILIDIGKSIAKIEGGIASLELDATLDETHEWGNEVTSSPVESGAPITDHIQPLNDKLAITGVISNTAISEGALTALNNGTDRVQDAYDALRKLKEDRTLVTVYTKYEVYTNMALASVNIPRRPGIGESISFTAQFQKVRIVDTQTVDVPAGISRKLDKKEGGKTSAVSKKTEPQKKAGAKATVPAENGSIAKNVLPKILDGLKSGASSVGSFLGGI